MADPKRVVPIRPEQEAGYPGLKQFGGVINDEWDRRLTNRRTKLETYREMQDSATISALLTAFDALMRSTGNHVNPADTTPKAQEWADFVSDCFAKMEGSWGDLHSEINSELAYGFSLFEIVYAMRDDGKIGWRNWAPRAQETIIEWVWDGDNRTAVACKQLAPPAYKTVEIPLDYCIHFKTRRRNQNPEGVSILRSAFDSYYYVKHIQRLEAIAIEKEFAGTAYLELPAEVINSATLLGPYQTALKNMRANEEAGIILPSERDESGNKLYDFHLVSSGGTRAINTDVIVNRHQRDMLRSCLADFLTLGDQGVGSFALGVSRADLFAHNVQAILDSQADTINDQAIKTLCRANGCPEELIPTFEFDHIPGGHIGSFASALAQMIQVGLVNPASEEVRKEVHDLLNIPYAEETDQPTKTDTNAPPPSKPGEEPPQKDEEAPATTPPDKEAPATFTEPVTPGLRERARAIWRDSVPDELAGLLDALVVEGNTQ